MQLETGLSKKARVEMIPLMDIVFLLLVFFIYAMVSMEVGKQGLEVNMATAGTAEPVREPWPVLSIEAAEGQYGLNRDRLPLATIIERVKQYQTDHPGSGLYIKSDKKAAAGRLIELFDTLQKNGVDRFVFLTEPNRSAP